MSMGKSNQAVVNSYISYPKSGTTRRVQLGTLAKLLGESISTLRYIVLVPLFLLVWGTEVYGEWLTVFALVAYLSLANIGMQTYVVNRLTQFYSLANLKDYNKALSSALGLYLLIILPLLLLAGILIYTLPFTQWLNIAHTSEKVIRLTAFLLAFFSLVEIPAGLIFGVYRSLGELPRVTMIENISLIFVVVVTAIVLLAGGGFISVALAQFIPLLFFTAFVIRDLRKRHTEIKFSIRDLDLSLGLSFIGPSLFFFLLVLTNAIRAQGPLLVIGATLGSSFVAIFTVHRIVCNLISKLTTTIGQAIWPELTSMEVRRDYSKLRKAHYFLLKITILISLSVAVFLFFTGKDVIRIWTRGKIVFNPALWNLFLVNLVIYSIWKPTTFVQLATNRHKFYSKCFLSSAVTGLFFAIILTKIYGVIGTLLGFMAAEAIICGFLVPHRAFKIIGDDFRIFWSRIVSKAIVIGLLLSVFSLFTARFTENTVLKIPIMLVVILIVALVSCYLFWLDDFEKSGVQSLIKKELKRSFV